jgi:hypothetical protein
MFRNDPADAAPENTPLNDEERLERRRAQEKEARERWNRELEEGKRAREARRLAREREQAPERQADDGSPGASPGDAPGIGHAGARVREVRDSHPVLRRQTEEALPGTPAGDARSAWDAGHTIYQITVPLVAAQGGVMTGTDPGSNHNPILNSIEAQGWRLEHASFVSSGRQDAASGDVVAVYVFRRVG